MTERIIVRDLMTAATLCADAARACNDDDGSDTDKLASAVLATVAASGLLGRCERVLREQFCAIHSGSLDALQGARRDLPQREFKL